MAAFSIADALTFLESRLRAAGLADVRVIPFGSHARGTAVPGSDVDIAIISSSFQGKDVFERALMTKDAELEAMQRFEVPFDILTLTPEELEGDSLRGQFVRAAAGGPDGR